MTIFMATSTNLHQPPPSSTVLHRPPPSSPVLSLPPAFDAPAVDHLAVAHDMVLVEMRHRETRVVRLDLDARAHGIVSLEPLTRAAHDAVLLGERGDGEVGMAADRPQRRGEI